MVSVIWTYNGLSAEEFEKQITIYSEFALQAGATRLRPVLMTAGEMIIGMLPMALGLGEGGEQNAPLGRAVIGGLIMATFATLFFVPVVYSVLRRKPVRQRARGMDADYAMSSAD